MSHYFEPVPAASSQDLREFTVELAGCPARVVTAPGVFSANRLDLGTAVLLRTEQRLWGAQPGPQPGAQPGADSPTPDPASNLLDLGCGWGPLALALARLHPAATVWAVDVNPRALDLTSQNASRLGLGNIRVARPEEVGPVVRFARIWSNPPIRVGKAALRDLLVEWLGRLTEDGWADLVVHKNLGADSLADWLRREAGHPTIRLASAKGYRVLRAKRRGG
ncbi:MAG: methyltransferase [Bifidobacteriaceae bacterium]|nr:methyltransferase [Bifidobacteriaceae bacterium]